MIIIRGLNKAFGDKIIFSNFNLEIPDGSFVVISGDSGSGKSTLLKDVYKRQSVDGADWKSLFRRIRMGRRVVGE